jgi:hypothetical protein
MIRVSNALHSVYTVAHGDGQTMVPSERRAIGTAVRASVRNGSDGSRASAGSRQHSQTAAGACRRAESRVTDAHAVRRRDTTRPPGPSRGAACDGLVASVASSNRLHGDRVPRRVSDCPDRLPKGSRRTRNRSYGRAVFCHGLLALACLSLSLGPAALFDHSPRVRLSEPDPLLARRRIFAFTFSPLRETADGRRLCTRPSLNAYAN